MKLLVLAAAMVSSLVLVTPTVSEAESYAQVRGQSASASA